MCWSWHGDVTGISSYFCIVLQKPCCVAVMMSSVSFFDRVIRNNLRKWLRTTKHRKIMTTFTTSWKLLSEMRVWSSTSGIRKLKLAWLVATCLSHWLSQCALSYSVKCAGLVWVHIDFSSAICSVLNKPVPFFGKSRCVLYLVWWCWGCCCCCWLQRVIQNNTLDDRSVHNKQQWDAAIKFMEDSVKRVLQQSTSTSFPRHTHTRFFVQQSIPVESLTIYYYSYVSYVCWIFVL